jgi:hypothetical protein
MRINVNFHYFCLCYQEVGISILISSEPVTEVQTCSSGLVLEIMLTPGQTGRIGESETK